MLFARTRGGRAAIVPPTVPGTGWRVLVSEVRANGLDECCCIDSRTARKYIECCDRAPRIWILEELLPPNCQVIHHGGVCFRRTQDVEPVGVLRLRGESVWESFSDAECVDDCFTEPCRVCPAACCQVGWLPSCERRDGVPIDFRCCALGSDYSLDYVETVTTEVTGYGYGHVVACTGPAGESVLRGYSPGLLSRRTETIVGRERWNGRDEGGRPCGVDEGATRRRTVQLLAWTLDGWEYDPACEADPRPINPRYESTDTTFYDDDLPLFGRGVLPAPYYIVDRSDGNVLVETCDGVNTTPFDPATCFESVETVNSEYTCEEGLSEYALDYTEYAACDRRFPLQTRVRGVREWTVTVHTRERCKVDPCAPPRGGSGERPVRGAALGLRAGGPVGIETPGRRERVVGGGGWRRERGK